LINEKNKKELSMKKRKKVSEQKVRSNPLPCVFMKISDMELIVSKMKSLGVTEFKVETSKGCDPEQSNLHFEFFSRDLISFVHFRDYEGSGRVSISYCEGPKTQFDNELLNEKRALVAYVDDKDIYEY
jgi:hypothetical protein